MRILHTCLIALVNGYVPSTCLLVSMIEKEVMKYTSYKINQRYHNCTQSTLSTYCKYFLSTQNDHSALSKYFIRKLTDFFFVIIGEKASTNIPLSKMYHLKKCSRLTFLHSSMYIKLDDYPQYSDK